MITNKYRPKKLSDLAGQQLAKKIVKAILDDPDNSPKNIILYGKYGTGKSSMAKILARTLNCPNVKAYNACTNDTCKICSQDLDKNYSYYYKEYSAATMGSKKDIKKITNQFVFNKSNLYVVNNFEEFHLASKQAQSVLLQELEKDYGKMFNIFCTTEIDKIIDTIRSRCIEVQFYPVKPSSILDSLKDIREKEKIDIKESSLKLIAERSIGSVRNAHMEMNLLKIMSEKDFLSTIVDTSLFYLDFIDAALDKDSERAYSVLNKLANENLEILRNGFYKTILEINEVNYNIVKDKRQGKINDILKKLDDNLLNLIKISLDNWVSNGFGDDYKFKNTMLGLYQVISENYGN